MQEKQTIEWVADECRYVDQVRIRNKLRKIQKLGSPELRADALAQIECQIDTARNILTRRAAQTVTLSYPASLPVSQHADEIMSAILENQVVIVAGETGSGKTTQLPKVCLQAGLGRKGMIGHTQPRRLAARTVSSRIAEELGGKVGHAVGYQVRFTDQVSDDTLIKIMTDGILLSEIKQDRYLNKYEVLIIDEAHERSLNIDFLLGYLKQLLPRRPELKLIITSATIDVERFSKHFNDAPVFEVSGRTYPVDVMYRPPASGEEDSQSLAEQIATVVEEIIVEERNRAWRMGDILVFLPGEREIRDVSRQLRHCDWRDTEVLPLYARLSNEDQNRAFHSHSGRRIVLATNVAETSITVPGIRYVIDPGRVRMSRYSYRSKIQRLPIEAISQASANQRKGRCGRVAEGICFRLYSEEDFLGRPEFTDPEILRTNLAAVILKMMDSGLGEVSDFPFLDPPDKRLWNDGYKLLFELGAVDDKRKLSALGKNMARFPTDPRLSKMILSAIDENCLREVLIIVSGLSIQDPRERPAEKQQAADQAHAAFKDTESDFISFLNLWENYEEQRQILSNNQLKRHCQKAFLSFMRMREWREIHRQLHLVLNTLKAKENQERASYDTIHRALLSGLLGNIGRHDEKREYLACRNRKFQIFPGSGIHKKRPKWLFSAEIVETQQVYARYNAKIEPEWIEPLAGHLVKKTWSEPHWERKKAQVIAAEKVTLYGLEIVANRPVNYAPIDAAVCRNIFIRSGLVDGEYRGKAFPLKQNRALVSELEEIEERTRKRDVVVDDDAVYALYDQRLPDSIVSGASFERWFRRLSKQAQDALCFSKQDLIREAAPEFDAALFPEHFENNGIRFPLSYHFNPGESDDGVTLSVPVSALRQLTANRLEKIVPGLLRDKCIQLIKNLPRTLRRHFVPVPDIVDAILPKIEGSDEPLIDVLTQELKYKTNCLVPYEAWNLELLDSHLRFNIQVLDDKGKVIEAGRDYLKVLEKVEHLIDHAPALSNHENQPKQAAEKLNDWNFDKLEKSVVIEQAGIQMTMYPALKDCQRHVERILCSNEQQAQEISRLGIARLMSKRLSTQTSMLRSSIQHYSKMALLYAPVGQAKQLYDDFLIAAVAKHFLAQGLCYSRREFDLALEHGRGDFIEAASQFAALLLQILENYHVLMKALKGKVNLLIALPMSDLQQQLGHLVYDGFLSETPYQQLKQFPRYLEACAIRLEKMPREMVNERQCVPLLRDWWVAYEARKKQLETQGIWDPELLKFRWMLEELRVSWYAQNLGTAETVSEKRLNKQWQKVRRT